MIDLEDACRGRYRIEFDESALIPGQTREERLWLEQIPCKYGHIYIHGRDKLGAYCDRPRIFERLMAIPGTARLQVVDRELSVSFHPAQLEEVAELLQARRRRQLTDEERERLAAIGAAFRFPASRLPGEA